MSAPEAPVGARPTGALQIPGEILVAVDLSECSAAVIAFAGRLVAPLDARLHLVHIWSPAPFSPPEAFVIAPGEGRETLWSHVRRKLEPDLLALQADGRRRGLPIAGCRLDYGDPASRVLEEADRGGFDLIVVGTHGRTGFSRLALGSVAAKIVRHASCPVIIVPCEPHAEPASSR